MPKFVKEAVIAGTEVTSSIVDKGYGSEFAIEFPDMSGTTMTFEVASADGSFFPLHNQDGLVSVAITGSTMFVPTGEIREAFLPVRRFQIVSDTTEPAVRNINVPLLPRFSGR